MISTLFVSDAIEPTRNSTIYLSKQCDHFRCLSCAEYSDMAIFDFGLHETTKAKYTVLKDWMI